MGDLLKIPNSKSLSILEKLLNLEDAKEIVMTVAEQRLEDVLRKQLRKSLL